MNEIQKMWQWHQTIYILIWFLILRTVAILLTSSDIILAALRIPLFNATGLIPAVTALIPLLTNACAIIVDVVVPSPALESLLDATSCIKRAPTFSSGSRKLISRAMVTPSLTISGAP